MFIYVHFSRHSTFIPASCEQIFPKKFFKLDINVSLFLPEIEIDYRSWNNTISYECTYQRAEPVIDDTGAGLMLRQVDGCIQQWFIGDHSSGFHSTVC